MEFFYWSLVFPGRGKDPSRFLSRILKKLGVAQTHQINHQIKVKEVLLINEAGEKIGVVPIEEALGQAESASLDLVAVDSNSEPVVCKIMDYGKHRYLQKKKVGKKVTQSTKVKEVRLRPKIEHHDLEVKIRQARNFLEHNSKVRFSMTFRGREAIYVENGFKIMEEIYESLKDIAKYEHEMKKEGNHINMVLAKI